MSIEEGDEVITSDGIVGNVIAEWGAGILELPDYYISSENTIRADGPLRVRVDTEQEARELVEMAEQHGWDISTNFDHWDLSQINCVSLESGHVNTYCANRDTTCRHGVSFSDRPAQVEAYLEYHSEEETMSDLTHEPKHGDWSNQCIHCGVQDFAIDEKCPEHADRDTMLDKQSTMSDSGDRQREEDDGLREAIEEAEKDYEEGRTTPHEDVFNSGDQPAEDEDELMHEISHLNCPVCYYCGNVITGDEWSEPCPARQSAEDDDGGEPDMICQTDDVDESAGVDDGEGDVKRRLAKEILSGDTSLAGAAAVNKLKLYERAIRDHCELSDGVCEWTWDDKNKVWDSDCGESFQFWEDDPEENGFEGCPFCVRPIEITTDEGGVFRRGDLVSVQHTDSVKCDFVYVTDATDSEVEGTNHHCIGSNGKSVIGRLNELGEKVGQFAPDDDALEQVNPEAKGELLVLGNKGVFLWPFIESGGAYVAWNEMGEAVNLQPHEVTRTGIVLNFHEIAEVSDYE